MIARFLAARRLRKARKAFFVAHKAYHAAKDRKDTRTMGSLAVELRRANIALLIAEGDMPRMFGVTA